jgi:hypothetical protein
MDDKAEWVFRVLGLRVAVGPASGNAGELTSEALVANLRERMTEMVTEAKLLGNKETIVTIAGLAKTAVAAIEKGDLVAAELAVDALETATAEAKSAARRDEASQVKGRVSYRKAQIDWRQARGAALAGVRTLTSKMLADKRILDAPNRDGLIGIIQKFPELLPKFDEDLEEQLEAIDAISAPERRKPLIEEARATLQDYRALLNNEALKKLQVLSDDEFGGIDVLHVLDATLQRIEGSLSA